LRLETKASHTLIGAVVLLLSFAFFGFAIWLAQVDLDRERRVFDIHFTGSVAGLGVGGDVRYRGIKIGSVTDIAIDPDDPAKVLTRVEIGGEAPIRQGDEASLKLQGITGIAYVNIDGAKAGAKPLAAKRGQVPVIPSKQSDIERLFSSAPELFSKAIEVTENLAKLLGEENQESITGILADMKVLTGTIAGQESRVDNVLISLESSAADIAATMAATRQLVGRADIMLDDASETLAIGRGAIAGIDQVVTNDVGGLLKELKAAGQDLSAITATLARVTVNNEEVFDSFAGEGLDDLRRFINEGRLLVSSISRLTERLESGGARSLLGGEGAVEERR
jgi:phospholipid/cholesterol/gamma-HCH transport system substrate-binding protein